MVTTAAEGVDDSMAKEMLYYVGEEVDKVEEDVAKEFAEEAVVHTKMGLTSSMPLVIVNI